MQLISCYPVLGLCRWGALLLAYKRDLVLRHRNNARPIKTWSDLLQPALKGRIAFPDNPREFLGVAFKTFDHPHIGFNTTRADFATAGISADQVRERVRELKKQARLFSSQEHVRSLMTGDCWVCIGSSTGEHEGTCLQLAVAFSAFDAVRLGGRSHVHTNFIG